MTKVDYIVDTNVLIIANGDQSEQASPECKRNCVNLLFSIMAVHSLVIDGGQGRDTSQILEEYRHKLEDHGSGFGEQFLQWLLQNWLNETKIIHVPITPKDESFEEFPKDKRLKDFDPRDRKWIATARSHHVFNDLQAKIVQSADFKWKKYAPIFAELTDHPFEIEFICDENK